MCRSKVTSSFLHHSQHNSSCHSESYSSYCGCQNDFKSHNHHSQHKTTSKPATKELEELKYFMNNVTIKGIEV